MPVDAAMVRTGSSVVGGMNASGIRCERLGVSPDETVNRVAFGSRDPGPMLMLPASVTVAFATVRPCGVRPRYAVAFVASASGVHALPAWSGPSWPASVKIRLRWTG
jgi:hypothetical protein